MKSCGFNFDTTYNTLPDQFWTALQPEPVAAPQMVIVNDELARAMGLNFSSLNDQERAQLFAGNRLPEGVAPFAQAYAGHQFGHFALLGDGRAHVWGEHVIPNGDRFDIQFKGSGRTPYSRRGDGRAALGPMLREYLISEAMQALGVPTTRALAVAATGEPVMRESVLPGAILTRIASSHIRVGTFEFASYQGDQQALEALLNYTLKRHYPDQIDSDNKALAFLKAVIEKQADLIVHWMRVGFIHGVMNTDNMTLSGETIDYGPCAFMDAYDPGTVFSSIDHQGRYAFGNQLKIAQWNLARLAEALLPLIHQDLDQAVPLAEEVLKQYPSLVQNKWLEMMRTKLGLFGRQPGDDTLISDLLAWMKTNQADYTNTFRDLSQTGKPMGSLYDTKPFEQWYSCWQDRLEKNTKSVRSSMCLMANRNPAVIPRNHKVQEALDAANAGDLTPFYALLAVLKKPYVSKEGLEPFQNPPEPGERVYQTFCGT